MTRDPKHPEGSSREWPDPAMSRLRERVAALIALLVILAALSMAVVAFRYIGDSEKFGRVKDLLLIINPILGVVLGLAMVINMFIAATAGTLIPLGLRALKIDPALASSVFITTLTDVFGFLSVLGLATLFLPYLV